MRLGRKTAVLQSSSTNHRVERCIDLGLSVRKARVAARSVRGWAEAVLPDRKRWPVR